VTETGRSTSHFPRYGIEDIANTEPGYEVRIANNVVHAATNDVPANQNFFVSEDSALLEQWRCGCSKSGTLDALDTVEVALSASSPN